MPQTITDIFVSEKSMMSPSSSYSFQCALIIFGKYFNVSESRRYGYLDALEAHNIKIEENLILTLPHEMETIGL